MYLVGAGPGDPALITVRGRDLLQQADVVMHDRLVAPGLLAFARPDAIVVDVGKLPGKARETQTRIHRTMVGHAIAGRMVVRLKGGDPFVFGRGSEEVTACRVAGVSCEVVPGVTSAIAGPAAVGIPVTRRGVARSFAVVTGHDEPGEASPPISTELARALATIDTVVVLMGRRSLRDTADRIVAAGRDPSTPVACVQSATLPTQAVARGTLADIADEVDRLGLAAPMVTVIGPVAGAA